MTYTIDSENNITAHTGKPPKLPDVECFSTEKGLGKLVADWPTERLVATWNSFAGIAPFGELKPVKKFRDRQTAVARIWAAIQRLAKDVSQMECSGRSAPTKAKKAPTMRPASVSAASRRDGSKQAAVVELLRRQEGATLGQIMTATGWQAHTVRGFISGTLGKRLGLAVQSSKSESKERVYQLA